MRVYTIVRFGSRIRYAEMPATFLGDTAIQIPASIPKVLDPYICLKSTSNYKDIKQIEVQDKSGNTWFEIKTTLSLKKIIESTEEFSQYMK
jgi:hypothetical protein